MIYPSHATRLHLLLLLYAASMMLEYTAKSQTSAASSFQSTNAQPTGTSGRTVNAITGQPILRVLVRCGGDAMLTDYQGEFHCGPGAFGFIVASKPGYSLGEDAGAAPASVASSVLSAKPIEIRLYPEAIAMGTVTTPDGTPLSGITVVSSRSQYDDSGHHWFTSGTTRTNSRGEFRLPLPAGDYRLETNYAAPSGSHSEAVLPIVYPGNATSSSNGSIHIHSGETQRIDLHPRTATVTPVYAELEPHTGLNVRLTARSLEGSSILLRHGTTGTPGEVRLEMPRGSYTLEATRQTSSGLEQAQTRIEVGATEMKNVLLRFTTVNPIPVEIVRDPASTSDNKLPTASALGLFLDNTDAEDTHENGALGVIQRDGQPPFFNPPPGSYRLHAQSGGTWYVLSAFYGTSDLLNQRLTVAPGVGSAPVRLVVSDQTASLTGTLRLDHQPVTGWVYLISETPSATPVLMVHANAEGAYSRSSLPPGLYRAVAFEHRPPLDLEDPEALSPFSSTLRSVTVGPGDKATLDLEVTPFPDEVP